MNSQYMFMATRAPPPPLLLLVLVSCALSMIFLIAAAPGCVSTIRRNFSADDMLGTGTHRARARARARVWLGLITLVLATLTRGDHRTTVAMMTTTPLVLIQ